MKGCAIAVTLPEHKEAASRGWVCRDLRPIWKVADNYYGCDRTRGHGEKWQLSRTPWAKQILDDCQNPQVREVVLMAGSQCAKTAPMLVTLAWSCANRPSPKLWVTGNDDLAKDASMERIQPTLQRCPDSRPLIQDNRLDKTTWKIRLTTCTIDIAGAQSSTVLEQNPYAEIFGDEVRQWPEGSLQKVEKRQRSYTNAKRYLFSTPNLIGDEFHQRFMSGTRNEWVWPCMKCGHEQQLKWEALKYGKDKSAQQSAGTLSRIGEEIAKRNKDSTSGDAHCCEVNSGVALSPNATRSDRENCFLECCGCFARFGDEPRIRRHICEAGHWQAQNQAPQAGVVSYHWNALLPPWVRWQDLVDEWQRANELLKVGNVEPLKVFVCETLGEPWEEGQEIEKKSVVLGGYKLGEAAGEEWDTVFMVVDVQAYEFWHVVRGWKQNRTSKLLSCGRLRLWEDVRAKAAEFKLTGKRGDGGKAHLVFVDLGYNPNGEVSKVCAENGWTGMRGEDRRQYRHKDETWKLYSEPIQIDVGIGTEAEGNLYCVQFMFAQPAAQDLLDWLLQYRHDDFQIPQDVPEEYKKHLRNEPKVERMNRITNKPELIRKRTGPQHMRDCEVMGCVAASMAELIWELPKEEGEKK